MYEKLNFPLPERLVDACTLYNVIAVQYVLPDKNIVTPVIYTRNIKREVKCVGFDKNVKGNQDWHHRI